MKKTVTLILIFVMIFSISGCKRADFEDTALPFDTADEGTSENEKTPENETPQPEIQKPKGDKAEPCSLTLENAFSEYEVIVTLTKEETAKNKTYTEKDFADYDIFYVLENDEYYGNPNMKDSYPEYQGRTTLFLYLNSPSKENVLKTVKNLEKDERVFNVCPCPYNSTGILRAYLTEEGNAKAKKQELGLNDFNLDNVVRAEYCPDVIEFKFGEYIQETYTAYKKLVNNPYVIKAVPEYPDYQAEVLISIENSYYSPEIHTQEFFKQFTDMNITKFEKSVDNEYFHSKSIFLEFEKPTYQQLFDMASNIQKYDNKLVAEVVILGSILHPVSHPEEYILK